MRRPAQWSRITRRTAIPATLVLLLLAASEGASRAEPAGNGPPIRPISANSLEAARVEIGKALPGAGGRLFSVSPKALLKDLYLPLGQDGLCRELDVLLPSESAMTDADLEEVRRNLAQAGLPNEGRASFRLEDGVVRGVMQGMPVRLFPINRIPGMKGQNRVVLLDPSFLHVLYRNEVSTPIVELAWKLIVTLRSRGILGRDIVLLDLPPGDDPSLRYGFLPALLGEMIASPSAFAAGLPETWDLLQQAETAFFFAQYPEATLLYRKYLERNPGDASACYKIARMAIMELDFDMGLQWLNRAAAKDPGFARAFVEAAEYLGKKNLLDPAERILRGGVAAVPGDARVATSLASFLIMRGIRFRESGDPEEATAYFGMAAKVEGADPAVREKAAGLWKGEGGSPPATPP